ncbi:hypothetical protein GOODEAATRI_032564 [Goodea atripinnis]|uniref:Polyadenylate-binding protein-interacting protein 2 n=1 Tax=Goodea atripinnis TaxID=208336 RepID=A0ABV0PTH3_9TELE
MKDPTIATTSTSAGTGEVVLSSQFGSEEDPFAEYMWMENEEEFNRQVLKGFGSTNKNSETWIIFSS